MEEALWSMEDKLKLSTRQAALVFVCTASLVVGLCTATILKKIKSNKSVNQEPELAEPVEANWPQPGPGWGHVKKILMGSVRWSNACKWDEKRGGGVRSKQKVTPLLVRDGGRYCEGEVGWQSHNSMSPVWQRPILMGEKCELPRFSGLILYDESGKVVHSDDDHMQEQTLARTTLRDLL